MTTLTYDSPNTATGFRRLVHAILGTDASTTTLFLRLVLGAVMLPHGLQKAFGLFGGYGSPAPSAASPPWGSRSS